MHDWFQVNALYMIALVRHIPCRLCQALKTRAGLGKGPITDGVWRKHLSPMEDVLTSVWCITGKCFSFLGENTTLHWSVVYIQHIVVRGRGCPCTLSLQSSKWLRVAGNVGLIFRLYVFHSGAAKVSLWI